MPLYFAYGSNMDEWQMTERCPNKRFRFVGRLTGWRLCFPRYSQKRRGGVSSIEEYPGETLWGVVYEIPDNEVPALNRCEGFQEGRDPKLNSYNRTEKDIENPRDGQRHKCYVYIANPQKPYRPSRECYLNYIIRGAEQHREHGMPDTYITMLRNIEADD